MLLIVSAACPEKLAEKDIFLRTTLNHKDQVKKKIQYFKRSSHVGYIQVSYPKID